MIQIPETKAKTLRLFAAGAARVADTDTGLLPPGTLSIRRGGGWTQYVCVAPPALTHLRWGAIEMADKTVHRVAQPYVVMIGEFFAEDFVGARLFYSPTPVLALADQLYLPNLPNVNVSGYGEGMAIGWVCLRPRTVGGTDGDKIRFLIDACGGAEGFDTNSLVGIDGWSWYKGVADRADVSDLKAWETRSAAEGVGWTLAPELWTPAKVTGINAQAKHDPKGEALTLGMAMYGQAKVNEDGPLNRPFNAKTLPDKDVAAELVATFNRGVDLPLLAPEVLEGKEATVVAGATPEPLPTLVFTARTDLQQPAKKAAAKKAPAKKAPAKKAAAKKAGAKKAPAKKAAAKKAGAPIAAAKKAPTRKIPARKPTTATTAV